MPTISKSDLTVFEGLSIVEITGFEPAKDNDAIDPPGTANFFCELFGMADLDDDEPEGILWTDYDSEGWSFLVLIPADDVERLKVWAADAGYEVDSVEAVAEPCVFGDGGGSVEVLRHRDGWVIAR